MLLRAPSPVADANLAGKEQARSQVAISGEAARDDEVVEPDASRPAGRAQARLVPRSDERALIGAISELGDASRAPGR